MIINRIYEHQNLLSLVAFLVGLRTYQHPCMYQHFGGIHSFCIKEETASSVLPGARDFLFSTTSRPALFNLLNPFNRSRDSSVGIVTRYGLDGPGIESRWGGRARLSAPFQTGCEAHPASYTMGTGSFPGVKRPWRGVDHPLPSSAEVKERAELYIYSPSVPLWPVLG